MVEALTSAGFAKRILSKGSSGIMLDKREGVEDGRMISEEGRMTSFLLEALQD